MKEREDNLHLKVSKKILEAGIQLLMEELVFSIHLLTHSTKMCWIGNSLVVQCQDSALSLLRAWVQSLISELKSHKLCRMATKKKKKKKKKHQKLCCIVSIPCARHRHAAIPGQMKSLFLWNLHSGSGEKITIKQSHKQIVQAAVNGMKNISRTL